MKSCVSCFNATKNLDFGDYPNQLKLLRFSPTEPLSFLSKPLRWIKLDSQHLEILKTTTKGNLQKLDISLEIISLQRFYDIMAKAAMPDYRLYILEY